MSSPPLFCPFCRESFDGRTTCPDHGLALVPFEALPGLGRGVPGDDDPVSPYDLRFGRGWVFFGAGLVAVGMLLPLLSRDGVSSSLLALATTRATNLWTVPCVAVAQVAIVLRRRTLVRMRAGRAAVPALSLLGFASLGYTLHRVHGAAALLRASYGVEVALRLEPGAYLVGAGLFLAALGGASLGRAPR